MNMVAPLLALGILLATADGASAQLSALVSPGRLNKAHAQLEGVSNCLQCHSKGQQVAADKCLGCHKPIAARIAAKKGIHRGVTTDCITCHVEHAGVDADLRPFDQKAFDHGRDAGYVLDGLHAPLAATCNSCHKGRSFLLPQSTCASCHADPHKPSLGSTCSKCHSTSARFTAAAKTFNHATTRFPLTGAHTAASCESCHRQKQYKGLAFASCANCHTDPHKSKLGPTCESCHNDRSWRTTKVEHARTAFPLKGAHAAVDCVKCHTKSAALVKLRFDTCAACHTDPHKAVFAPTDCAACHTESSFQKGTFDHNTTTFPLTDKHQPLACVACHKTTTPKANDFRGLTVGCASCHEDVHRGELGTTCETCHTAKSFLVTSYTHARQPAFFAGQHAPVACVKCHDKTVVPSRTGGPVVYRVGYRTTPTTCVSCHQDVHLGQVSTTCENCHAITTARFGVVGFSHAITKFPLTGKHGPVPCEKCHKVETSRFPAGPGTARRLTGITTTCATCHADPHQGQLGPTCQTCHTSETFVVAKYVHQNARTLREFFTGRHNAATCIQCHTPLVAPAAGTAPVANYRVTTRCTSCHTDVHKGALGTDCAACHKP